MKKKITYYKLLTLLKNNQHPYKVKLYLGDKCRVYVYNVEHGSYILEELRIQETSFSVYLRDAITDMESFKPLIEVME